MGTEAPADSESPDLEAGRLLFSGPCQFVRSVEQLDTLPDAALPEVAFAGRSNVGKSSLINALVGHKALARTSSTPGRTQLLNLFDLGGRLMLVDMPGYGYAQAPKDQVRQWTELVRTYLRGRPGLRRVCLLIDSRHGIKDNDREMMRLLDKAAVSYQTILTKSDKPKAAALQGVIAAARAELVGHVAAHPRLIATSAETGAGLPELRAELAALAAPSRLGISA